jgi:hypothetical protein
MKKKPPSNGDVAVDESTAEAVDMQLEKQQAAGDIVTSEKEGDVAEANEESESDQNQQGSGFNGGFGFDNMNGTFPNMNMWNGNPNQMDMMMAMQAGMANGFGAFPMMGSSSPCILSQSKVILTYHHRNDRHEHGSDDDAEHVHERGLRISGHGHEYEHGNGRLWQ